MQCKILRHDRLNHKINFRTLLSFRQARWNHCPTGVSFKFFKGCNCLFTNANIDLLRCIGISSTTPEKLVSLYVTDALKKFWSGVKPVLASCSKVFVNLVRGVNKVWSGDQEHFGFAKKLAWESIKFRYRGSTNLVSGSKSMFGE